MPRSLSLRMLRTIVFKQGLGFYVHSTTNFILHLLLCVVIETHYEWPSRIWTSFLMIRNSSRNEVWHEFRIPEVRYPYPAWFGITFLHFVYWKKWNNTTMINWMNRTYILHTASHGDSVLSAVLHPSRHCSLVLSLPRIYHITFCIWQSSSWFPESIKYNKCVKELGLPQYRYTRHMKRD